MAESRHGNFQSCCRLCLTEKLENLKSVFAEGTDNRLLPEKISEFVAVEMNSEDKLTTMICHQCVMKVNHWHAFKQRCLRNQSKLVQWMDIAETNNVENMNIQIKEEPKDVPEIEEKPTEHLMEYSTQNDIDCPTNDIAELPESNVEVVMVKPEPLDHLEEPMEEEYNELPPPLTPYVPEVNLEVDEGSPDLPEPIQNNGFPRCTNQRKNYIKDMDDFTFFRKFRLYKGTVLHIQEQIKHELENDDVNNTLSPINQLLLTLRFYATGEYRNSFNFGDVDNSMIKSIISKVSKVIASLGPQYMKMPENQAEEKIKFHTIANFPKTIGVIDGTHIKIQNPGGDDAEVFKNRKGYYSINAQVVCSSDLKISNIVARWPGSVCDATVFMNSRIRARFENEEFGNCVILGINTEEANRRCTQCNKLFSSAGNRRKHEKHIHGMHHVSKGRQSSDLTMRKSLNGIQSFDENGDAEGLNTEFADQQIVATVTNTSELDPEQQKIIYAAGLKLIQTNSTPISMEPLSKIELSYVEKCKAMVNMHKSLECACHNVPHPNLKGLLSHLRALRIWFPVFTCYNCMITFTDRSTFTKHSVRCPNTSLDTLTKLSNLRKRSEVKTRLYQNFRCTYCKFMYTFHEDFIKHVDEDHSALEPPVTCGCSRHFDNLEDYKDHVYVSCLVEFYCDICFITTRTLDGFQKHAAELHDSSEGFVLLQDDNYKVRKHAAHAAKESRNESPPLVSGKRERKSVKAYDDAYFEAEVNNKVLNPAVMLSPHIHGRICPICGREYSSYFNMMRHYKKHVENNEISIPVGEISLSSAPIEEGSLYSCPECGGMYDTKQWQKHLEENHEPKICGECGKIFQFQTELDNHRSVHLNLKVYRDSKTKSYKSTMVSPSAEKEMLLGYESSNAIFSTKEEPDVQEPKKVPTENPLDKKFTCKPCKKTYASYAGLWEHTKNKHPEKKTPYESSWPKKCSECDKVCSTGAALHRHKMVHEKHKIPAASAPTKIPIIKTKQESDVEDESYHTCKRCFKVFSSKYNLKNHMKCHGINMNTTKKKQFKEEQYAGLKIKEEKISDSEMPDLKQEIEAIFTCNICVETFTSKAALKAHKDKHMEEQARPTKQPKIYCKYCKIPFGSIVLLTKHMYEEHEETAKPKVQKTIQKQKFVCHICKKSFQTSAALTTHVGWHKRGDGNGNALLNNKNAKVLKQNKIIDKLAMAQNYRADDNLQQVTKFQCTTCLAEFPNDTALQVHILEKHRSVSAIMLIPRCNTCNKDFNTQDDYETHKRLHDFLERQKQHEKQMQISPERKTSPSKQIKPQNGQQKNFPCKYCTAGFTRSDTLAAHMRHYHKDFVQTEFKCTQCDRVFDKQNSLSIHLKVHEKQRSVPSAPKPLFSCSICNMGFNLPKDLRAHTISAHPF